MNQDNASQSSVVFDFSASTPREEKPASQEKNAITYQMYWSDCAEASPARPFMILSDPKGELVHHERGSFLNPHRRTAFVREGAGQDQYDIARIDRRFVGLMEWLGENKLTVRLSGRQTEGGYGIYRIHAVDPTGRTNQPTANDGFLQLIIKRLLASKLPEEVLDDDEEEELAEQEEMMLTDLSGMEDFLQCAYGTLPGNIRRWAQRNLALAKSRAISPEERRHAQRAVSMMLNIQWKGDYFESIDSIEARRILDEELYGLDRVKQRIIETIIQINRTHTLPAYGLLLAGPAGIGKSQIAYAVARILRLPWTSLDMSAIHDSEALTGSPRVYSNAKPGRIMEAFSKAGASNLVFIINELDKADANGAAGNPADALLTLLDNLGYTDNYIECMIPTGGVYPIATANDKSKISEPLMTRFAVIDIPDYTPEEKKIIFRRFSLPKILRRLGMSPQECVVTDEAVDVVVDIYKDQPGCRDLEQAAEHLAAHALYRIETRGISSVCYDGEMTRQLLGEG